MGDGVNIAARLEGIAAPGGISAFPSKPIGKSRGRVGSSLLLISAIRHLKNIADTDKSLRAPGRRPCATTRPGPEDTAPSREAFVGFGAASRPGSPPLP